MNRGRGHWAICSRCDGNGAHSNRLGAISAEQFAEWDEESIELYFAGGYDEPCEGYDGMSCEGGKVWVSDEPGAEDDRQAAREAESERRYWQRIEAHACGERD